MTTELSTLVIATGGWIVALATVVLGHRERQSAREEERPGKTLDYFGGGSQRRSIGIFLLDTATAGTASTTRPDGLHRPVTGPSTTLQDDLLARETRLNHAFPDMRHRRGNVNLTQHVISIARVTRNVMPKNPCPPASVTHLSLVACTPSGSDLAWLVRMLLVHVQHARQAEGSG